MITLQGSEGSAYDKLRFYGLTDGQASRIVFHLKERGYSPAEMSHLVRKGEYAKV